MPLSEWKVKPEIEALQEGDKALYRWSWHSDPEVIIITKRTPTMVCAGTRRFNLAGEEMGRSKRYEGALMPYDEKVVQEVERRRYQGQVLAFLKYHVEWQKLPFELQEQIAKLAGFGAEE